MTILNTQIDVRTQRLHLRTPRESDAEQLYRLFANWEVIRWLDAPPWPYAPEHACEFVGRRKLPREECITAAIVLDAKLIGIIDALIKQRPAPHHERGFAVGYWIGQPFWGQGYMSEAAAAFIGHVFAAIADDAIYSGAFRDNAASLRIQDKLGFTRDSESMFFSNPHGKDMLHVHTSLTRARFAARPR